MLIHVFKWVLKLDLFYAIAQSTTKILNRNYETSINKAKGLFSQCQGARCNKIIVVALDF